MGNKRTFFFGSLQSRGPTRPSSSWLEQFHVTMHARDYLSKCTRKQGRENANAQRSPSFGVLAAIHRDESATMWPERHMRCSSYRLHHTGRRNILIRFDRSSFLVMERKSSGEQEAIRARECCHLHVPTPLF